MMAGLGSHSCYCTGKLVFENGDIHEGEFSDDELNGNGKEGIAFRYFLCLFNIFIVLLTGKKIFHDGIRLEGEFKDGKLNG